MVRRASGPPNPSRFDIPGRPTAQYPVAFPAESVAHFQTFGSGGMSKGRAGEAGALYGLDAYLTETSNYLVNIGRELESIEALIIRSPSVAGKGSVRPAGPCLTPNSPPLRRMSSPPRGTSSSAIYRTPADSRT
jgi:hypothetical protein